MSVESRTIRVNGQEMHYRLCTGMAPPGRPPVVLVHGLVASSRYMAPLIAELAPDFDVYAPDLPGFGKSWKPRKVLGITALADALAAWMTQLDLPPSVLVGNSLGCNILVEFAPRHAKRVKCLVLQGPSLDPTARTVRQTAFRWLLNNFREPSMGRILWKDYAAAGPRRALLTFCHLLHHPIEDRLPHVEAPSLVLRGTRDPIVPHDWARRAAALLPRGHLLEIEGAAHTLNYFWPEQFARAIRHFVGVPIQHRRRCGTEGVRKRGGDANLHRCGAMQERSG